MNYVNIIGAGLAGTEAAWQLAKRGILVNLYEMRPHKMTPAHKTSLMAELVCSNSFRSDSLENAAGLLKKELSMLDSLIIQTARCSSVPAGGALAVDRKKFSEIITEKIISNKNINIINEEIENIPDDAPTIIASGPLTSKSLSENIKKFIGEKYLHFFDAVAPLITKDSIDFSKVFRASRYGKGDGNDYLNCAMTKDEYDIFYQELIKAEVHKPKDFEKEVYFEGCMPIEVMAKRGYQTLLYGPLKPVGLINPQNGEQPYAVVQLRKENVAETLFNIVGFQTSIKWEDQKKIIRLIPGLQRAEIERFGVMHVNTYISSPRILLNTFQTKKKSNLFFAGQITGVEGYIESTASGLAAGINASLFIKGKKTISFPKETSIGALSNYIVSANPDKFQPMNINFGLLPELKEKIKNKKNKKQKLSERAIEYLNTFISEKEIL